MEMEIGGETSAPISNGWKSKVELGLEFCKQRDTSAPQATSNPWSAGNKSKFLALSLISLCSDGVVYL